MRLRSVLPPPLTGPCGPSRLALLRFAEKIGRNRADPSWDVCQEILLLGLQLRDSEVAALVHSLPAGCDASEGRVLRALNDGVTVGVVDASAFGSPGVGGGMVLPCSFAFEGPRGSNSNGVAGGG